MRHLCSATGKTIFISPTVAKEGRDKHYYDVLRRKIGGRRYKHRRGRAINAASTNVNTATDFI